MPALAGLCLFVNDTEFPFSLQAFFIRQGSPLFRIAILTEDDCKCLGHRSTWLVSQTRSDSFNERDVCIPRPGNTQSGGCQAISKSNEVRSHISTGGCSTETTFDNFIGPVGTMSTTIMEVKGSPWSERLFVLSKVFKTHGRQHKRYRDIF
jgi:hypothetical protein